MYKIIGLCVLLGVVAADHIDKDAEVKSLVNDIHPDGSYQYSYDTSNGISAQEAGSAGHASGSAHYTSPEGAKIEFSYTADENGFLPQGSHLPVAPPIPEAILRSLAWIQAHPNQEERVGGGGALHKKRHI